MAFAGERPQINRVATKTTTYPMTDDDAVILADATGGAFTVTTPDATSVKTGVVYTVVKIDSSANAVTVDGSGAQTINGAATESLSTQYQSITIASNGTNWFGYSNFLPSAVYAPSTPDYLVGTAQAGLSAEIVVGTSPGGELGGTWASPTVDSVHSGSAHHGAGHALLSSDHTDVSVDAVTEGSLIIGNSTPSWGELVVGAPRQGLYAKTGSPKLAWATPAAFIGSSRSSNIGSASGTVYIGPFGTTATTEANANVLIPVACRAYNLYVFATSNTFDGTLVCTVRKNGAGTTLTVTITAGSTATFSDLSNIVQFAAGDKICLETTENATTGTINIAWSLALAPDLA